MAPVMELPKVAEAKALPLTCMKVSPLLTLAKYILKDNPELDLKQPSDSVLIYQESDSKSHLPPRDKQKTTNSFECYPFKPHLHTHSYLSLGGNLWKIPQFFSV